MSHRKKYRGICHLCGSDGDLTFEHVPPRKAFNDKRTIKHNFENFEDLISLGPDEPIKGSVNQGGIGYYSLCARCNNDTGGWYGKYFVDWCYQAFDILISTNGNPTLLYINHLFPLPIIKQIVTMFFSVNGENFGKANPELVHFVLNKKTKYLSPKYRLFVFYNIVGKLRYSGITGRINTNTGMTTIFSEITFPPFGYVLSINSAPPDDRLYEITHFSRYSYNEFATMYLKLPVLPTYLWYPGDYRTKDEINEARKQNEKYLNDNK